MAGKVRHLLDRDGRYFARLVVPKNLRRFLEGKTELRTPLGPDRRIAIANLPSAVAALQFRISQADQIAKQITGTVPTARYPLTANKIAALNYQAGLAFDEKLRRTDSRYASFGYVDFELAARMKEGMAGRLNNTELSDLVADRIERYRLQGNTDVVFDSPEWRDLAMALCFSEYEGLARSAERDEGDFTGQTLVPFLSPLPMEEDPVQPVPLRRLFTDYIASRKLVGKGREAERRWAPVIKDLISFLGHNDAGKLTKTDLRKWRDAKMTSLAPKTVSVVYLAAIRTILQWAVENDVLPTNEAATVRQEVPRKVRSREQGYTTSEANRILSAARTYAPARNSNHRGMEAPATTAAKRWVPFLCALTGARIVEITQLRRQDIRLEGDTLVMRITPEAGTVKTGLYRDVPVHPQLVDLGFEKFVEASQGPLFYVEDPDREPLRAARSASASIGKWLHANKLTVDSVAPNHGWRHRFKTVGREAGIGDRVLDALTGHASTTAGDAYGDVTIKTKAEAIAKLPFYDFSISGRD